ncbi:hypothetical protein Tco_0425214, partial [Tanacetum coccineum]
KVDKHRSFTVNLKRDGVFSPYPFSYINGDEKQLTDINFEDISYADLRKLVRKFFHEGEEDVVIKNITTNDPFLTKLCSNNEHFRGFMNEPIPANDEAAIREKFLINVILSQCKRAKQRAVFDFEGGLIEHYGRLWEYMHVVLDINPRSSCILEEEETKHGNQYFKRMYICFKGVADGWKPGCRRVIRVENNLNWSWFLSLLQEDLELGHEAGLTIISDSHKAEVVREQAELVGDQAELVGYQAELVGYMTIHLFINTLQEMTQDEIWSTMEHEYMEQLLVEEEEKRDAEETARQDKFDQVELKLILEEEVRFQKEDQERLREDEEFEWNQKCWRLTVDEHMDIAHTTPNGRGKKVDTSATPEPQKMNKQGRKRKQPDTSDSLPLRIYHKNMGRSERIFNQKMKKSGFGPNGERSTANNAISI